MLVSVNNQVNLNKYSHPNFGAMIKSQFSGVDLCAVVKFKAPIKKFKTNNDFQVWAKDQVAKIIEKDYKGRLQSTIEERKRKLGVWFEYITKKESFTPAMQLLILSAITGKLDDKNDNLPPVLNKNVLSKAIDCVKDLLKKDSYAKFNFENIYRKALRVFYFEKLGNNLQGNNTGWFNFSAIGKDNDDFAQKVEVLEAVSPDTWCTKSALAGKTLAKGDFHVYIEDGNIKMGIRLDDKTIEEVQGVLNNDKVPLEYLDILKKYIADNRFEISDKVMTAIGEAQKRKNEIDKIKLDIAEYIEKGDNETVLKYFNINVRRLTNGKLVISNYRQPNENYTFKDLGLDEKFLLKDVIKIFEDNFDLDMLV